MVSVVFAIFCIVFLFCYYYYCNNNGYCYCDNNLKYYCYNHSFILNIFELFKNTFSLTLNFLKLDKNDTWL